VKPAIEVVKGRCVGCFGCFNVCRSMAIDMKFNKEGFYTPVIDKAKCVECGRCCEVCPVISLPVLERLSKPFAYASWSKDERTRMTSSSGGVFTEIARTVLEKGGVVYGVVWGDDLIPVHERAENNIMLKRMRGSKYVQSYVGEAYRKIIGDLERRVPVLFSGTPCQVAALNRIVGKEKSTNLYEVDIVCQGVPSPTLFKKYLMYVSNGRKIVSLNMRDKSKGWTNYQIKIEFEDGSSYVSLHRKDLFLFGYLSNLFLNNSCYNCPFSMIPRQGDVTLGDFWGVAKRLRDERGVSLVLVNSEKGEQLIRDVRNIELFPVKLQDVARNNPRVMYGEQKKPRKRETLIKISSELEAKEFIRILKLERIKNRFIFMIELPYLTFRKLVRT